MHIILWFLLAALAIVGIYLGVIFLGAGASKYHDWEHKNGATVGVGIVIGIIVIYAIALIFK